MVEVGAVWLFGEKLEEFSDKVRASDDQRSTTVNNTSHSSSITEGGVSNTEIGNGDDVIGVVDEGVELEVGGGELGVITTQDQGAALFTSLGGQVEGEGGVLDEALFDEEAKNGGESIFRDVCVSQTEDTSSLGGDEVGRDGGHQAESNISDVVSTEVDSVVTDGTSDITLAVWDDHLSSVILEGSGRFVLELGVSQASEGSAALSWDPEIGRTSIEDNGEFLWGSSDGDRAVELSVHEVGDGDTFTVEHVAMFKRDGDSTSWLFSFRDGELEGDESESRSEEQSNDNCGLHILIISNYKLRMRWSDIYVLRSPIKFYGP